MAGDDTVLRIDRLGLPLALVATMVGTAVYVTQFIGDKINRIESGLSQLRNEIAAHSSQLDRSMTQSQAIAWIATFRAANPTITVPELFPK